jgi:hypothetical protein
LNLAPYNPAYETTEVIFMSPKAAAILTNPHPGGHIVYPYTDENLVAQAVCLYASAGLRNGEAVVLITTRSHYAPIDRRLTAEDFDTEELQRTGQLTYAIAEKLLPVLLVKGMPDEDLFRSIVGRMIERAQKSGTNGYARRVRAFGEMVGLLWPDNLAAAQRLEELWDEMIKLSSISLLCTYALTDHAASVLPAELIACHSHNIGRETTLVNSASSAR